MDGHTVAAPMTFMHAGKQYIGLGVGGNNEAEIVVLGIQPQRGH